MDSNGNTGARRRNTRAHPDLNNSLQMPEPPGNPPPTYQAVVGTPSNFFRPTNPQVARTPVNNAGNNLPPVSATPQNTIRPLRNPDIDRVRQELDFGVATALPFGVNYRVPPPSAPHYSRDSISRQSGSDLSWDHFGEPPALQAPEADIAQKVNNLEVEMHRIVDLLQNLSTQISRPVPQPVANSQQSFNQPRQSEHQPQPRNISRNPEPQPLPANERHTRSRSPISRWGLTFDGPTSRTSIEDFIYRIEKFKRLDGISDDQVAQNLHLMLSGDAERWFWIFEKDHPNASWPTWKAALLDHFRGPVMADHDDRRITEIVNRKQGQRETVDQFYTAVLELNNRLMVRRSEAALITIMRENLLPRISDTIETTQFHSLEEFRRICTGIESRIARRQQQHRYEQRNIHELQPVEGGPDDGLVEAIQPRRPQHNSTLRSTTTWICWNCDQIGHSYRQCEIPHQGIFCYTCGQKGVVSPKCARCHPENGGSLGRPLEDRQQSSPAPATHHRSRSSPAPANHPRSQNHQHQPQ